ncbi:hypothetical protein IV203_007645 [Nitzschia inconspicua]|uniref:Uncharacterized protein n=1 Tax=Nitzschia inconspicua TaxID=303405 RepID=A0A9K3PCE4_9STRA|nr:hypothetical protein IV203_007645 [Nitzschia inconspicua]
MLRCRFPIWMVVVIVCVGVVCLSLLWNVSCCHAQQQQQQQRYQQHRKLKSSSVTSSSSFSSSHESIDDDDTQNTLLYVTSDGSIAGVLEWNGNIFVTINNNYDDDEIDDDRIDINMDIENGDENMNHEVDDNDNAIATSTSKSAGGGGGTLVKLDLQGKEQVVSKIESTIFFNNAVVAVSSNTNNDHDDEHEHDDDDDDGTIVTLVREANGIGVQIYGTNTFQKTVLPTASTNDHPRNNNNNHDHDDDDDEDNEDDTLLFFPAYTLSANCFLVGPHLGTMALSFQTIHDHQETNWVVWNRRGEILLPVFSLNNDNSHDDDNDSSMTTTTTTTMISTDLSSCPAMSLDESTLYISALVVDSTTTKQQRNDNESPQTTTTSSILLRKLSLQQQPQQQQDDKNENDKNENGSANGQDSLHDPIPTNSVVSGPAIHPIDGTIYLLTNQPYNNNDDQRQHFVHQYHPETLRPLAKIALPKLNGFMAQPDDPDAVLVVNPIFSSDATRMYFFGTKAIVGINTRWDDDDPPLVLFQYPIVTPSPFSSWIKPFLTNDGTRILLLEQLQRHHHEEEEAEDNTNTNANTNINTVITVLDARTGTVHTNETIMLHPDWDISAIQLNQADDCLYIAYTLRTDDDTVDESQSSRLVAIPHPWKQQQQQPSSSSSSSTTTTTTMRQKSYKEPWSAFFLELILYPTILITCLACQVYRMYRNNRNYNYNNAGLRGAYQPINNNNNNNEFDDATTPTHKEMELTQLQRQEELLSAEYGDLDYDDDEEQS